jgi:hypothetical protein
MDGEDNSACKIFGGEGQTLKKMKPLGSPRHTLEGNIKIDLK